MQDAQEKQQLQALYAEEDVPQESAPQEDVPVRKDGFFRRRRNRWKQLPRRKKILRVVLLLVVLLVLFRLFGGKKQNVGPIYTDAAVERGSITAVLSGSGRLEPADAYTVTSLVSGEVLAANFEEGDVVEQDTLLFSIDSSESTNSIERTELNLDRAQRTYDRVLEKQEDLTVKAPEAGTVTELLVEAGDDVAAGQVLAQVLGRSSMTLEVPFLSDDAAGISPGQTASVTLADTFEILSGRVTEVSGADVILPGNRIVRYVTVDVPNPGALTDTVSATAAVGDYACVSGAALTYKAQATVTAPASGTVLELYVREGSSVGKNQPLLYIESTLVQDEVDNAYSSLRDVEIALANQKKSYNITSPIQGTVVEKNYKTGDNLEAGHILCTVYDLSYLTMTLYVDELDIHSVAVGQQVTVTAEAVGGQTYSGLITAVSIKGVVNGSVTTYPVTIRMDETEGLLPGMNVDCEIITAQADNTLRIPADAVERGDKVLVPDPEADGSDGAPAGYRYQPVTLGITDGNWIEITGGLSEGDTVSYIPATVGNSLFNMMMGMGGAPANAPGGPGATGG